MLLMIDNYDSFTYNLVQYFGELGQDVQVFRNDETTLDEIARLKPQYIVISPGPCTPNEAGVSVPVIKHFAGKIPLLGVCLGHQSIGQAFGGNIIHAKQLMHGKTSMVTHRGIGVFRGLPNPFQATRYHSLVIDRATLPDCLEITAWTDDDEIMGVRHKTLAVEGVQFHPESIMTEYGHEMLDNFLQEFAEMTPQAALHKLIAHTDLTREEMLSVMQQIMRGDYTAVQIAGILVALRMKGETVDEIAAAAEVMRTLSTKVQAAADDHLIDTCGTGGDGIQTFNISTIAAFVAAAAGAKVAKHGGRSVSSTCGSADVLEAFGVKVNLTPDQVARCVDEIGIGFMFAPNHHSAMKHAAPVRRELGVRTLFNLLGPLTNPAGAKNQVMGVFDRELTGKLAHVLQQLGSKHVMVVHGADGMDEISFSGDTFVAELQHGRINEYVLNPQQFGLALHPTASIRVHDAEESKRMILAVLQGKPGSARDIVLLNAGAAIYVAGMADNLEDGIQKAALVIDNGSAQHKLDALVKFSSAL